MRRRDLVLLLYAALFVAGYAGWTRPARPSLDSSASASALSSRSNIHARDYVGPQACAECHVEKHRAWRTHPHSRMNLDASAESVVGDFSGRELSYAGRRVRFHQDQGAYFMTLVSGEVTRRYRVTRTIGSRFTQMYAGVLVEGPEPPGDPAYEREGKLPFGWWISRQAWYPEPYFDSDCPPEYDERGRLSLPPELAHQTSWSANCIYCHNTYAYEERLREAGTQGFPARDLRLREEQVGEDASPGLDPSELVTLGISCESCHFGGREHAQLGRPISFLPQSEALEFRPAGGLGAGELSAPRRSAYAINSICNQCHYSQGVSPYPNGAGIWNSREAVDLLGGACQGELKCTDCHDPHQPGPPGGGPDQPAHVAACLECHQELATPARQEEHGQHSLGAGVSCLDCHMPRIVQGLEAVVRTHRVSSPGDPRMIEAGAPNACNLCHLDRSIAWTASALELGWGRRVSPPAAAYAGRLDAPVGQVWLASSTAIHRLVGADAYSRSPLGRRELPRLIRALDDPMAVNRVFAQFSLERVLGRRLSEAELSPLASPARRRAQLRELLARAERGELLPN